jgi:hypothetical protein
MPTRERIHQINRAAGKAMMYGEALSALCKRDNAEAEAVRAVVNLADELLGLHYAQRWRTVGEEMPPEGKHVPLILDGDADAIAGFRVGVWWGTSGGDFPVSELDRWQPISLPPLPQE